MSLHRWRAAILVGCSVLALFASSVMVSAAWFVDYPPSGEKLDKDQNIEETGRGPSAMLIAVARLRKGGVTKSNNNVGTAKAAPHQWATTHPDDPESPYPPWEVGTDWEADIFYNGIAQDSNTFQILP